MSGGTSSDASAARDRRTGDRRVADRRARARRTAERTSAVTDATAQRLVAAAEAVGLDLPAGLDSRASGAAALQALVGHLVGTGDTAVAWLLLTAVAGRFPSADDVRAVRRAARLADEPELTMAVLDRALPAAASGGTADRPMRVVGGVVVDLDSCARSDFHNGIQRVARETTKVWGRQHPITVVAWTDDGGITRAMTATEERRAAHWGRPTEEISPVLAARTTRAMTAAPELVVPWRATLVLAEVPVASRCPALAALAEFSGTSVVAIGYDAIPLVSADLRPFGEPDAFTAYLTVIKHSARVAGISRSATVEFAGYVHALTSQGLRGPDVVEVQLPSDVPPAPPGYRRVEPPRPRVVSVGRFEPHKNHGALLHAAEVLWREGLEFDLDLIGGTGWTTVAVDRQIEALERAGRPVRRLGSLPDDELWRAIRDASFTVFVSVHEGFGLPVSESLACGTPVVTTRYGSQGEIAEQGGCITVDPRDDADVAAGLRSLLTDGALLARLRAEAAARPGRTWQDYADELWTTLVEGATA